MKYFSVPLAVMVFLSAPALAELVVVEDRGGASALPYYEALDSPKDRARPSVQAIPPIRSLPEAEAALLPVRSIRLSPGDEPPRAIRAPGLTPMFLVGDDERSQAWLQERYAALREMRAVGLVVNVSSPASLAGSSRSFPSRPLQQTISPNAWASLITRC